MLAVIVVSGFAMVVSIIWCYNDPGYETLFAVVSSLSVLVAAIFSRLRQVKAIKQTQNIFHNGLGMQSGGDINIENLNAVGKRNENIK